MIFLYDGFWIVTGWRHIWSRQAYLIDAPNCWVSYRWPARCIKREENPINIAKPCIHKAAGSGINEMLFPIFSWRYTLFIILEPGLTNSVQCTASMPIYSCVCQKILKHLCWPFSPLHIFGFHYFLQHATIIVLLCGMSFTLEIKKTLYATLHSITRERYFTERWM